MLHYKKTNQLPTIVDNYKLPSSLWLFSPASHGRKCPVHKAVWWSSQVISEGKETVTDRGKCTRLFCSTFSLLANLKYQDNLGPWKVFYSQVTQHGALHPKLQHFTSLSELNMFSPGKLPSLNCTSSSLLMNSQSQGTTTRVCCWKLEDR